MKEDQFYKDINEIEKRIDIMLEARECYTTQTSLAQSQSVSSFRMFLKRLTSKLFGWYSNPLALKQTKFNNAVTPAIGKNIELLNQLFTYNKESSNKQKSDYDQLTKFMHTIQEELNAQIVHLGDRNEELNAQIAYLINQNEELHGRIAIINEGKISIERQVVEIVEEKKYHTDEFNKISRFVDKMNEMGIVNTNDYYYLNSYSQSGEDGILDYVIRVLGIPYNEVSYIDLGANHPKDLSNTFSFYSKGARGVIVEANPNLIPRLNFFREGDIVLNRCMDTVSEKEVTFYIMNVDGLSTMNYEAAIEMCNVNPNLYIAEKRTVRTISINDIIDNYMEKAPTILSIDLEGKDIEILNSINFERFRPLLIVVEVIDYDTKLAYHTKNETIKEFLLDKSYEEYAFTGINSIFIDANRIK